MDAARRCGVLASPLPREDDPHPALLVAISFKVIVNASPTNVTLDEMKAIVEEAQIEGVKVGAGEMRDEGRRGGQERQMK